MHSGNLFLFQDNTLHYRKIGQGPDVVLLFHGFGQDGSVFLQFAEREAKRYTFFLFDLYYHGKSIWKNEGLPLEKKFWKELITEFINQNKIDRCTVGGFSMGAKFAIATAEAVPERISDLILIAPDGIARSVWYSIATSTNIARRLFKSMILHPSRFERIVKALDVLHLVDPGLLRFARNQMSTQEKRERVYYSWVILRKMNFNLRKLAILLDQNEIRVTLFTGKKDLVINSSSMNRFVRHLSREYRFEIIDTGHQTILRESLARLHK